MENSEPLAYAPGLEPQHPTMSMIQGHGGHLDRERERERLYFATHIYTSQNISK